MPLEAEVNQAIVTLQDKKSGVAGHENSVPIACIRVKLLLHSLLCSTPKKQPSTA